MASASLYTMPYRRIAVRRRHPKFVCAWSIHNVPPSSRRQDRRRG